MPAEQLIQVDLKQGLVGNGPRIFPDVEGEWRVEGDCLAGRVIDCLNGGKPLLYMGWQFDGGSEATVCGVYDMFCDVALKPLKLEGAPVVAKLFRESAVLEGGFPLLVNGYDKAAVATLARGADECFSNCPEVIQVTHGWLVEEEAQGMPLVEFMRYYSRQREALMAAVMGHTIKASEALLAALAQVLPDWSCDQYRQRLVSPEGVAVEVDLADEHEPQRCWENWVVREGEQLLALDADGITSLLLDHLVPVDLTVAYQLH